MTVAERDHSGIDAAAQDPDRSDVEVLFKRLAACGTHSERRRWRQRIITECLPLADHIAYRYVGRGEPSDDLIQVARIGLVKSVDRYEPTKGRFMAYAVPTIRGEVRRHFRDGTWSMRVPRKVQETQLRMRHAVETLSQRLNRPPTYSEVARELGIGDDDVAQSDSAHWAYRPLSLDAPRPVANGSEPAGIGATQGAEDPGYETVEDSIVLREVVAELDPRRRAILGMRFFDGLTQREIALRLNVSQVQVSRLLDDTLSRLRRRMSADTPSPTAEVA
ncbi:SigB/SigF/SigG family RNA polymerase sigma factor [Mycolicibacterium pyrenivorans]|uniref:SigB/SigF/SigG family RNA polymerase sigma factor n=1 Tax=Mycolicibacterium pyrenivorans TaxID=187102 RepID=UPI0021F337CE|nr:SigB/SigF/SigG family RNA polymerase sigma factor [Mycolicibacterium pyrenivorans]MCV7153356.1 SigB/SigF/SigG family RNA polymerase sigma factor [Mycolicibacterium pyrenivorans]